jgi:sarcosine oxidase
VAAGPWAADLLASAAVEPALEVSLQTVAYFGLADPGAPPVALIDYERDEPYGCWDPARGLKAALHRRGPAIDPDAAGGARADACVLERIAGWVRERYGPAVTGHAEAETCMYTNAPGERFVLERRGRVVLASACSGQGFQLAPDTGERAAGLAAEVAELAATGGAL